MSFSRKHKRGERRKRKAAREFPCLNQVRDGADVIFVTVSEDDRLHLIGSRLEIGKIGNHELDPEVIEVR